LRCNAGKQRARSIALWLPVAGWTYVDCLRIHILCVNKRFSITVPLLFCLNEPQNGWWALKSPSIINEGGNCWTRSSMTEISTEEVGGRYKLQSVMVCPNVILKAWTSRLVLRETVLCGYYYQLM